MFINNEVDEAKAERATSTVQSSLFVLFQPFKLLDNGVELKYVGKDSISSKSFVDVIQPLYGNENNGSDRWWFYFDTKTYLLAANMVSHNGRYSFIENLAYDSSTNFIFNAHRKSYFVDSLKNTKILRAEYFYKDLITNY